jgi:hypothetical protein
MPVRRSRGGFSLVETLVAVGLLLLACLTAGHVVLGALQEEDALAETMLVDRAVESERARLAALPYYAPAAPPTTEAEWRASPVSLLGEVFPHGVAGLNLAAHSFLDDAGVAVFVTHSAVAGVDLESRAVFLRPGPSGWTPLATEAVSGWTIWQTARPPAATVEVVITGRANGTTSTRRLHTGALAPAVGRAATAERGCDDS